MSSEVKLFELRRAARDGQRAQLRQQIAQLGQEIQGLAAQQASKSKEIELIERELDGVHELYAKNLVQLTRLTPLEREATRLEGERGQLIASTAQTKGKIAETELQIIQIDQDMSSEVGKELREVDAKIGEFVERKVTAEDQLKRIDIRAPQDGTVFQSAVHTVGGVITAGDAIMLIVPEADNLTVEAKVNPQDIDQLQIGQTRAAALHHLQSAHHAGDLRHDDPHFGRHHDRPAHRQQSTTRSASAAGRKRSPGSATSSSCPACRSRRSCRPAIARYCPIWPSRCSIRSSGRSARSKCVAFGGGMQWI